MCSLVIAVSVTAKSLSPWLGSLTVAPPFTSALGEKKGKTCGLRVDRGREDASLAHRELRGEASPQGGRGGQLGPFNRGGLGVNPRGGGSHIGWRSIGWIQCGLHAEEEGQAGLRGWEGAIGERREGDIAVTSRWQEGSTPSLAGLKLQVESLPQTQTRGGQQELMRLLESVCPLPP